MLYAGGFGDKFFGIADGDAVLAADEFGGDGGGEDVPDVGEIVEVVLFGGGEV
ncbi:hypothetical protein KS4_33160 [Poriferisphaera corsica]|uniref:Uncharacterized protein n=1 Tax=Poriferisphaera corsica TaxID=2528020 RepID=A0A517YYD5_9BACT|nr:hypothetical protein KS4_33160 [Poriferisphaera corsica]